MKIVQIISWALLTTFKYPQAHAAQGPGAYIYSGSTLSEPTKIYSSGGYLNISLTVSSYSYTGFISFNTRAFTYNGASSIPGPTLYLYPGDVMQIILTNSLAANADNGDTTSSMLNSFHSPNSTNFHSHGLRCKPMVDTVLSYVSSGSSKTYVYSIPADHAPGIHWYHSHHHGASALQVMGGLIGAIYILPPTTTTSAALLQLSKLTRYVMLAQHVSMSNSDTSSDAFRAKTYAELTTLTGSTLPVNAVYTSSTYQDIYLINGQFQPTLSLTTGQYYILDLVNTAGDYILEIDIRNSPQASSVSSSCNMLHVATDGVYFETSRSVSYVVIIPSSRQTVVISCSDSGTFYLTNVPDTSLRPGLTSSSNRYQQNMVTLVVTGSSTTLKTYSVDLSTITRPTYLTNLQSATVNTKWSVSVEQPGSDQSYTWSSGKYWMGIGSDCSLTTGINADQNLNCKYIPFEGQQGSTGNFRHLTYAGAIEEISMNARGSTPAPIHLHANVVQLVSATNSSFTSYFGSIGDWRDTVPLVWGQVVVRYTANPSYGEIVVHNQFLALEDQGLMGNYYSTATYIPSVGTCNYPNGTATNGYCSLTIIDSQSNSIGIAVTTSVMSVVTVVIVGVNWSLFNKKI